MALVRGRGPGVSTDMVALAAELLRRPCEDNDQDRVDPHITWAARLKTLAADNDRDVAEAEARGWNAAVEAALAWLERVDHYWLGVGSEGQDTMVKYWQLKPQIAALRKPEVEG